MIILFLSLSPDVEGKSQPVILLLYAYDCPLHEQVVSALAAFLMEACGATVTLDLLEENDIVERGIDDWLVDRLQEADYILVLCSLGARLRCSKKRVKFKSDDRHALPDYFAVAVDYVAEKMRAEKQKGLSMNKFIMAYMEYSTRSDIPPQLETGVQLCLMKDIHKLHTHLNTHGPDSDKSETTSQASTCENHYHETETGALLKATIEQAKMFFRENPTWLDDRLEVAPCGSVRGPKSRKYRQSPVEQPLLTLVGTPPVLQYTQQQNVPSQNLSHQPLDKFRKSNMSYTLPRANGAFELLECGQSTLETPGIFQGRQNSLPSSLASSCLAAPAARHALSKSMDSFAMDQSFQRDHDGLPCFFCNSTHMDGRPECRQMDQYQGRASTHFHTSTDVSLKPDQVYLHLPNRGVGPSRSQTILQAEVHLEWGHTSRDIPEQKSATFAGDPRSWNPDLDAPLIPSPYQSLPPHHPPPHQYNPSTSTVMEWDSPAGLRKWSPGYSDSPVMKTADGKEHRLGHRSLSDVSLTTDDSGSVSDGDLLERDLRSIQNISSFHDFVTTSSFTGSRLAHKTFSSLSPSSVEMTSTLKPLGAFAKQLQISDSSTLYADTATPSTRDRVENV